MNTKQVKLEESGLTAHIKTKITYGEHQSIQASLMGAAKGKINPVTRQYDTEFDASATIEWTFKKQLVLVTKLIDKEGKETPISRKALEDLPMLDGQKLEEAVDLILDGVKKK